MDYTILEKIPDTDAFLRFISKYPYKPYYYLSIPEYACNDHFINRLNQKKDSIFLVGHKGREYRFFCALKHLDFDSDIFGHKMGRLECLYLKGEGITPSPLNEILAYSSENNYDFIDVSINTQESHLIPVLSDTMFRFTGTVVTYGIDLSKWKRPAGKEQGLRIRDIQKQDYQDVFRIAEDSFSDKANNLNRFIIDGRLKDSSIALLYRRWTENCISGRRAQKVLVADIDGKTVGFIACNVHDIDEAGLKIGDIPLNAVDRNYRQKGIYKELVLSAFEWFSNQGIGYVEIKTQITTVVPQYVWQKNGGKLVKSEYNFHKWINLVNYRRKDKSA